MKQKLTSCKNNTLVTNGLQCHFCMSDINLIFENKQLSRQFLLSVKQKCTTDITDSSQMMFVSSSFWTYLCADAHY